ncbi:thiamine kinase, partial [Klebsiella pneumoniae]
MLFSNNKLTRDELLSRFFPHYHTAAAEATLAQRGDRMIMG